MTSVIITYISNKGAEETKEYLTMTEDEVTMMTKCLKWFKKDYEGKIIKVEVEH